MAKLRPFDGRGRIPGQKDKPSIPVRTLDLVYLHQERNSGSTEVTVENLKSLAEKEDPPLLEGSRLHWGLHFLVDLGHLKRVRRGRYTILE